MKKILLLSFLIIIFQSSYTQDTLLMNDGTRIVCKIDNDDNAKVNFSFVSNNKEITSFVEKKLIKEIRYERTIFDELKDSVFYIEAGFGRYASFDNSNSAGEDLMISFSWKGKYVYNKIRVVVCHEQWFGSGDKVNTLFDIGYLIGKSYSRKYFSASINVGLGIVFGEKYEITRTISQYAGYWNGTSYFPGSYYEYSTESKKSIFPIGIPFEFDVKFIPTKNFAIGSSIVGNMNKDFTYLGIIFKISFGNLRKK